VREADAVRSRVSLTGNLLRSMTTSPGMRTSSCWHGCWAIHDGRPRYEPAICWTRSAWLRRPTGR
jgi:hypothetical protein